MPDNTLSTLAQIQSKTRRLTRSLSEAQLSTTDLNNYINTFVLYDMPEQIRQFKLRKQFTFFCNPYQDVYITDATLPPTNPLYNFQNIYTTIHAPVYIAGYNSFFSQSREQFFGIYPITNSIVLQNVGNGIAAYTYTGTITNLQNSIAAPGVTQSTALLQNQVLFSSLDANLNGLSMIDVPVIDPATGNNTVNGNLYMPGQTPATPPTVILPQNTVNYATGVYAVTFSAGGVQNDPGPNQPINAQTVPQVLSLPQALLYYENKFIVRPVPDQPYRINFEAYMRPTELLQQTQSPDLAEWWQYIAFMAAKKIFEDRFDYDSVAAILPACKEQERLCLRRTIVQYTNERTATIYTENVSGQYGSGWWTGGGSF